MSMLFGGFGYQCAIYINNCLNCMTYCVLFSLHVLSHTDCIHTHTIIAPSGTPKWLTVRCSHPISVQLSWGAVPEDQQNGRITGFSIQVEGSDTTRTIKTIKYCNYMEVCDLRPSTEYSFSVSAKTVAGSGPAISVSFVTPQEGDASLHTIALMSM